MKINLFLFLFISLWSLAGQECQVSLEALQGDYAGECRKGKAHGLGEAIGMDRYKGTFKKGLPDGKGTYTWANGNKYTGEFKKGRKDGKGELIFSTKQGDSLVTGFWKKDEYLGQYEKPYQKLDKSQNISSINLTRIQKNLNSLRFTIRENQTNLKSPVLTFSLLDGQFQNQVDNRDFVELTGVTFPIRLKVFYRQEYVELEIFEPGLWNIVMDITYIKGLDNQN